MLSHWSASVIGSGFHQRIAAAERHTHLCLDESKEILRNEERDVVTFDEPGCTKYLDAISAAAKQTHGSHCTVDEPGSNACRGGASSAVVQCSLAHGRWRGDERGSDP